MSEKIDNQIESVISTAINSLKQIVDVNTVIGEPFTQVDGTVIVPVSKVTMGFLAGGGEYSCEGAEEIKKYCFPFAGGSGAYVQLSPIGFLVGSGSEIKPVALSNSETAGDKLVEAAAQFIREKTKAKKEE